MSWVSIDDGAPEHRKQLQAGPLACWLWVCGLAYCNRQKARDGFIPEAKVPVLFPMPTARREAARLVEVGLWEVVPGGYRVHDYEEYQLTAAEVEARREARRAAGKLGGQRSGETRRAKQERSKVEANAKQVLRENEANASGASEANANPLPLPLPQLPTEAPPVSPEAGAAAPAEVAEQAQPSGSSDLDHVLAELARVSLFAGRSDVRLRASRLVTMADGQSGGQRPIAPYVAQAVDKLASRLADDPKMKPSAALSWVCSAAEGAWRERKLVAKAQPTDEEDLGQWYAQQWARAREEAAQ